MIRTASLASLLAMLPAAAANAEPPSDTVMESRAAEAEAAAMSMPTGLMIGEPAPNVTVLGPAGEVTFPELAGEKGTVIAFFRSADWCRYCKKQLIELKDAAAPLAEDGWTLVGVSYDSPEILAGFQGDNDLPFTLYSDTGSAAIVLNLAS